MSIFKSSKKIKEGTTTGLVLGKAEAESYNEKQLQNKVYIDCFDVISQIGRDDKFIILGRKGSGKTAVGEYIKNLSEDDPNSFACFIKNNQVAFESIVQLGNETGVSLRHDFLFEWIILTKLLELISSNENCIKDYSKEIKRFIEKNRGFIQIDKNQVIETIKEKGFDLSTEQLKRICGKIGLKWNRSNKETKAPFYLLLPNLKEIIGKILENDKDNSYYLIFDDLDINFKSNSEQNLNDLLELIRIAKEYNNSFLRKNHSDSRIIILLRNDISKYLQYYSADSGKIFASYSIELNWYDGTKKNENEWKIKKFINKRLSNAFKEIGYTFNENDPWDSFVDSNDFDYVRSFKYVLDHTFYRPRDLLCLFGDVGQREYPLPLKMTNLNDLIGEYVVTQMNDISNELSLTYNSEDIIIIQKVLQRCSQKSSFDYAFIKNEFDNAQLKIDIDKVIEDLFDYSLIGNKSNKGNPIFKCRETREPCKLNKEENFVVHKILEIYFLHNRID